MSEFMAFTCGVFMFWHSILVNAGVPGKKGMNLRSVRTVRDSGAWSAIRPAPSWSLHQSGNVRSARGQGAFTAGSPGGQNPRGSTIDRGTALTTAPRSRQECDCIRKEESGKRVKGYDTPAGNRGIIVPQGLRPLPVLPEVTETGNQPSGGLRTLHIALQSNDRSYPQ
jgi:hypothetical protein